MPDDRISIRFFDVLLCVSRALDLLSPALADHHFRVAYVSACIARELGLPPAEAREVAVAGALHDAGAVSMQTRLSLINHALAVHSHVGVVPGEDVQRHAIDGYRLLRDFAPFAGAATAIRFHHVEWEWGKGCEREGETVPLASHILRVADDIAILPRDGADILAQAPGLRRIIADAAGAMYHPEVAAAFARASTCESFWLDLVSPYHEEVLRPLFGDDQVMLASDEMIELAKLFARIIDYRSPYTGAHSATVAAAAERLAALAGMSVQQQRTLSLAGYLHDLGKLAVPSEILDKPAGLTPAEELVIRQHPYHTYRLLANVPGLEEVALFGALHHERLDGSGYPFRAAEIPLGARIVAVADVFSAVTEDRPYRGGMSWSESLAALDELASDGGLDRDIVALIRRHPDAFHGFVKEGNEVPLSV